MLTSKLPWNLHPSSAGLWTTTKRPMLDVHKSRPLIPLARVSYPAPRRRPLAMPTFKRALVAAAAFILLFFLLSRSHSGDPSSPLSHDAPSRPDQPPSYSEHGSTTTGSTGSKELGASKGQGQETAQKPLQDMSRMTVGEKLAYQFPYDVESKFPAYIWQTWKYTPAQAEFVFREEEASWSRLHPGFTHEVLTDDVAASLVKLFYAAVPEVVEAYESLPLPVLKADLFRYLILLARGGVYSDIDTSAIKPAVDWVPETVPREAIGLVIGIEADPDRDDWADWYSRRIQFCQWTIQAKAGHPVLREVVSRITSETLRRKRGNMLVSTGDKAVIEFTGPAVWTDVIFEYFNDPRYFDMTNSKGPIDWRNFTGMNDTRKVGDVIVLPITSFSPGVAQMGAGEVDDPMAFVQHRFEGEFPLPSPVLRCVGLTFFVCCPGTWKPESLRHIGAQT